MRAANWEATAGKGGVSPVAEAAHNANAESRHALPSNAREIGTWGMGGPVPGNARHRRAGRRVVRSLIMSRLKDVCIDCADPWSLSHWWAEVLGYRVRPHTAADLAALRDQGIDRPEDDPSIALDPIDGSGPTFWFNRVSEPKTVKNRVHVDVYGDADHLLTRGATLVERRERWTVMTDPEGNEFCVFAS